MRNPIVYLNSVVGLALGGRGHRPDTALHRTETWSGHATLAILAGIILEILAILGLVPRSTEWEKGYAAVADILIGVGLIIEYICIRAAIVASGEQKRESDAKLAEALDRAATAQRELVKFRTPRRSLMPAATKQEVADKLRPFARTPFDIGFGDGDCTAARF
jgi:hypothetical protein